jgi:hypothetical protein
MYWEDVSAAPGPGGRPSTKHFFCVLLKRVRHVVVAPGLPSQFSLQAWSASYDFDLCDLTRFPPDSIPFSCVVVLRRSMRFSLKMELRLLWGREGIVNLFVGMKYIDEL